MSEGLNLLIRGRALPKTRFVSKHNYLLITHRRLKKTFNSHRLPHSTTNIDKLNDQKNCSKQIRSNESELILR